MEDLLKKKYLIIGSSSKIALNFIKNYKYKFTEFYGISSKKPFLNSEYFIKVFNFDEKKKISSIEFTNVLIISSRLPSEGGNLLDFVKINKKVMEILNLLKLKIVDHSRITFLSSFSVFKKELEYVNDITLPNPSDYYGESKLMMEKDVINFSKKKINCLICRIPVFLYPNGNSNFINKIGYFCKTRKDVKLFNPYKKLGAVFDLNNFLLLDYAKVSGINIVNCGADPDITFSEIGNLAIKYGAKNIVWENNEKVSTLVDLNKLTNLINRVPSAKVMVSNWFSKEFSNFKKITK